MLFLEVTTKVLPSFTVPSSSATNPQFTVASQNHNNSNNRKKAPHINTSILNTFQLLPRHQASLASHERVFFLETRSVVNNNGAVIKHQPLNLAATLPQSPIGEREGG